MVHHQQIQGDQMYAGDPSLAPRPPYPPGDDPEQGMGISDTPGRDAAAPNPGPVAGTLCEPAQDGQQHEIEGNPQEIVGNSPLGLATGKGTTEQSSVPLDLSPLANLEPLRSALPDVTGHDGTVE